MLYSVAHWAYHFEQEWQQSLFEQTLADMGFDSFDGEDAYIPTHLLDVAAVEALAQLTAGVTLCGIDACEDQNWNAVWEAEHPAMTLPMGVTIVPHCAFGAGYHDTTAMLIDRILHHPFTPDSVVLDNGCGTGVLAIMAAKCGAGRVVAVDIDTFSVQNTIDNAALNQVVIDTRLGDCPPAGHYDVIMSNIHRNILIQQMALYAQYLRPAGELWISGFYESDCPALLSAAEQSGLRLLHHHHSGDWHLLAFTH